MRTWSLPTWPTCPPSSLPAENTARKTIRFRNGHDRRAELAVESSTAFCRGSRSGSMTLQFMIAWQPVGSICRGGSNHVALQAAGYATSHGPSVMSGPLSTGRDANGDAGSAEDVPSAFARFASGVCHLVTRWHHGGGRTPRAVLPHENEESPMILRRAMAAMAVCVAATLAIPAVPASSQVVGGARAGHARQ